MISREFRILEKHEGVRNRSASVGLQPRPTPLSSGTSHHPDRDWNAPSIVDPPTDPKSKTNQVKAVHHNVDPFSRQRESNDKKRQTGLAWLAKNKQKNPHNTIDGESFARNTPQALATRMPSTRAGHEAVDCRQLGGKNILIPRAAVRACDKLRNSLIGRCRSGFFRLRDWISGHGKDFLVRGSHEARGARDRGSASCFQPIPRNGSIVERISRFSGTIDNDR